MLFRSRYRWLVINEIRNDAVKNADLMDMGFFRHAKRSGRVDIRRNGNRFDAIPVQGVTYRLRAVAQTDKVDYSVLPERGAAALRPIGTSVLRYVSDAEELAQIYDREQLCAGDKINGPAIVREALSTTYITQNQTGVVGRYGEIVIRRRA